MMTDDFTQCEGTLAGTCCTGPKGHLGPHGLFVMGMVMAPWPNTGLILDESISDRLRCDIDGGLVRVRKMESGGDISCVSCDQVHTFTEDRHTQIVMGKLFPSIGNWHTADEDLRNEMLAYHKSTRRFSIDARLELGLITAEQAIEISNEVDEAIVQFHDDQARFDSRPWYKKLRK